MRAQGVSSGLLHRAHFDYEFNTMGIIKDICIQKSVNSLFSLSHSVLSFLCFTYPLSGY